MKKNIKFTNRIIAVLMLLVGSAVTQLYAATDITISTAATSGVTYSSGTYTPVAGAATAVINVTELQNYLANTNVTITSASTGTSPGSIKSYNDINWSSQYSLTMRADYNITVAANITNGGSGGVNIYACQTKGQTLTAVNTGIAITTNGGDVNIFQSVDPSGNDLGFGGNLAAAGSITTNGGNVKLLNSKTSYSISNFGVRINNVSTGSGNFTAIGYSKNSAIRISGLVQTTTGNIDIQGTQTDATLAGYHVFGVAFDNSSNNPSTLLAVQSESGDINIKGTLSATSPGSYAYYAGIGFGNPNTGNAVNVANKSCYVYSGSGNTTIEAISSMGSAMYFPLTSSYYMNIGWDGSSNVTTGNITIKGAGSAHQSYFDALKLKTNGGQVFVGDNGSALASLILPATMIESSGSYKSFEIGGTKTASVTVNPALTTNSASVDGIKVTAAGGITVNTSGVLNTSASSTAPIILSAATGATGPLLLYSQVKTGGGSITIQGGIGGGSNYASSLHLNQTSSLISNGGDILVQNSSAGGSGAFGDVWRTGIDCKAYINAGGTTKGGNITINGTASTSSTNASGIFMAKYGGVKGSGVTTTNNSGNIKLIGQGAVTTAATQSQYTAGLGIQLAPDGNDTIYTDKGNITLIGTGAGSTWGDGIKLSNTGYVGVIYSNSGRITFTTGASNHNAYIANSGTAYIGHNGVNTPTTGSIKISGATTASNYNVLYNEGTVNIQGQDSLVIKSIGSATPSYANFNFSGIKGNKWKYIELGDQYISNITIPDSLVTSSSAYDGGGVKVTSRGFINLSNYIKTSYKSGLPITLLASQGAAGYLRVVNNLTTNNGAIKAFGGLTSSETETGYCSTVGFESGSSSVNSNGGDITIKNSSKVGATGYFDGRGVIFGAAINAGAGNVIINGYSYDSGTYAEGVFINGPIATTTGNISIYGKGGVGGISNATNTYRSSGIWIGETSATISSTSGNITLYGKSGNGPDFAQGIDFKRGVTQIYSATGTININGEGSHQAMYLQDGSVYIGSNSTNSIITTGDVNILGSSTATSGVVFDKSAGNFKINGKGNLTIGAYNSTGTPGGFTLSGNIVSTSWKKITLGDLYTGPIVVSDNLTNTSSGDDISVTSKGSITINNPVTNNTIGKAITVLAAQGAAGTGTLTTANTGTLTTNNGTILLRSGVNANGSVISTAAGHIAASGAVSMGSTGAQPIDWRATGNLTVSTPLSTALTANTPITLLAAQGAAGTGTLTTATTGTLTTNNGAILLRSGVNADGSVISTAAGHITANGAVSMGSTGAQPIDWRASGNLSVFTPLTTALTANTPITLLAAQGATGTLNASASALTTNGGNILLSAGTSTNIGCLYIGSTLTSNNGNITLANTSSGGINNAGIYISAGKLYSGTGNITITGYGGKSGAYWNEGVLFDGSGVIQSTTGTIAITGYGGGGTNRAEGMIFNNFSVLSTSGDIALKGTGGSATRRNDGIHFWGGSTDKIYSTSGNITLTGIAKTTDGNGIQTNYYEASAVASTVYIGYDGTDASAGTTGNISIFTDGVNIDSWALATAGVTSGIFKIKGQSNLTFKSNSSVGTSHGATFSNIIQGSAWKKISIGDKYMGPIVLSDNLTNTTSGDSISVVSKGNIDIYNPIVNNTVGKPITLLASQGAAGFLKVVKALTTNNGAIKAFGGLTSSETETGYCSTVGFESGSSVNSNGGDITIKNSSKVGDTGYYNGRGVLLISSALNAGAGNITVNGYAYDSGTYAEGVFIEGSIATTSGNISIYGKGGTGGASTNQRSSGIWMGESAATISSTSGNITLYGKSGNGTAFAQGIDFKQGITQIYSATGTINLNGEASHSAMYLQDGSVYIGSNSTNSIITTGDVNILGSSTAFVFAKNAGNFKINGKGNLTIGSYNSTGSPSGFVLSGNIVSTSWKKITLGDLYTGPIVISDNLTNTTSGDDISVVSKESITINNPVTNNTIGKAITVLAAQGAAGTGTLTTANTGTLTTNNGTILLRSGVNADGSVVSTAAGNISVGTAISMGSTGAQPIDWRASGSLISNAALNTSSSTNVPITLLSALGTVGRLQLGGGITTNGGKITLYQGRKADGTDLNYGAGTIAAIRVVTFNMPINSNGGDIDIQNSQIAANTVQGVRFNIGTDVNAGGGNIVIKGYTTSGFNGIENSQGDLSIHTTGTGTITMEGTTASDAGILLSGASSKYNIYTEKGDISIKATSTSPDDVAFAPSNSSTTNIYSQSGNITLKSSSASTSPYNTTNSWGTATAVNIGTNNTVTTTGNINVQLSGTAPNFANTYFKTNGGSISVGDNGANLGALTLPAGSVVASGAYKSFAIGGTKTASVAVNTPLTAATDGIQLTAIGDISGTGALSAVKDVVTVNTSAGTGASAYSGTLAGDTWLTKTGAGIFNLSAPAQTFTGNTTITGGELRLNPSATTATWASPVVLNGGTLSTTGITANTVWTSSKTLTVNDNSTIALASGTVHSLKFAASPASSWAEGKRLTVTGWTGTTDASGTAGKVFIGTDPGGLGGSFNFYKSIYFATQKNYAKQLATGEVVPTLTPEIAYTTPNEFPKGKAITPLTPTLVSGAAVVNYTVSPALPAGLTFSVVTGAISGTPTAITAKTTYVVMAMNAYGASFFNVEITVTDALPVISYTTPNVYTKGTAISSLTPTSTGGAVASYSVSPALPAGLALNTTTGVISGTPTAVAAQATYTVTATNITGQTGTFDEVITVNDIAPVISYTTPNVYPKGSAIIELTPVSTGGTVVSYSVNPALPAGLELNATTGVISGTPTAITAQATYTVTATNSGGNATADVVITVTDALKQLSLKVYLQGLWNGSGMNQCLDENGSPVITNAVDVVDVELHDISNYATIVYKATGLYLDVDGTVHSSGKSDITIPNTFGDSYYITVRTRNHLETTTSNAVSFAGSTIGYDFTTAAGQAYGDNQADLGGGVYGLYVGDVPDESGIQDGIIDATDASLIDNQVNVYAIGYTKEDLNGDGVVDGSDVSILDNNVNLYISSNVYVSHNKVNQYVSSALHVGGTNNTATVRKGISKKVPN